MNASLRRRRASTVRSASSGVAPAMNFLAIRLAAARAVRASHSARTEPAGASASPRLSHHGTWSPASARYSARCSRTDSVLFKAGNASMKRKSCTRTKGSSSVPAMNRSSHQAACQGLGPLPIRSNSSRPISLVRRSNASERERPSPASPAPRPWSCWLEPSSPFVPVSVLDAVANLPAPF